MTDFSDFLIASDLDGTFLWNGSISARNQKALGRFCAGGGIFTLATGRSHLNLRSAIGEPTKLLNAPAICANGAYLYDFSQQESFRPTLLCASDAKELVAFSKARFPDVRFSVSAVSCIRSEENAGCVARDMQTFDQGTVCISPADTWPQDDWYKFIFLDDRMSRLQELRQALLAHFGERFTPTCSSTWIMEIQHPGVNKALGLQKLKMHLDGAKNRTVIACGDFDNDIEMLQAADVAISPENALDGVKAAADHVFCHCKDGLIADIIEAIEKGRIRPIER